MANLYVTITEEITLPNTTTEKTQTFKIINGINQIVRRVDTITTAFSGSGIEIIRFCNSEAEQTGGAFVKQDVQYIRITNLSTQYDTLIYLVANDNTESALFNLSVFVNKYLQFSLLVHNIHCNFKAKTHFCCTRLLP